MRPAPALFLILTLPNGNKPKLTLRLFVGLPIGALEFAFSRPKTEVDLNSN